MKNTLEQYIELFLSPFIIVKLCRRRVYMIILGHMQGIENTHVPS